MDNILTNRQLEEEEKICPEQKKISIDIKEWNRICFLPTLETDKGKKKKTELANGRFHLDILKILQVCRLLIITSF